ARRGRAARVVFGVPAPPVVQAHALAGDRVAHGALVAVRVLGAAPRVVRAAGGALGVLLRRWAPRVELERPGGAGVFYGVLQVHDRVEVREGRRDLREAVAVEV